MTLVLEKDGMQSSLSDAGVGATAARAAAAGAWYNVMINLPELEDDELAGRIGKEADELLQRTIDLEREMFEKVKTKLLAGPGEEDS
jgi:glutamate formiminotransferase/formiminotetrahydrofolate cyclodeaminase